MFVLSMEIINKQSKIRIEIFDKIEEEQRANNRQDKEEGVRAEREGERGGEKMEKTVV